MSWFDYFPIPLAPDPGIFGGLFPETGAFFSIFAYYTLSWGYYLFHSWWSYYLWYIGLVYLSIRIIMGQISAFRAARRSDGDEPPGD